MAEFEYRGNNALAKLRFLNRTISFLIYSEAIGHFVSREIPINLVPDKYHWLIGHFTLFLFWTQWNLMIHYFYFGLCLVTDLFPKIKGRKVTKILDFIYNGLLAPITASVAIGFWSIYIVDPNLILPEIITKHISMWYNHVVHTFIIPITLIEGITTDYRLTKLSTCVKSTTFVTTTYCVLITYIGETCGWFYPFLDVLPFYLKVAMLTFCIVFAVSLCVILYKLKEFMLNRHKVNVD